VPFQDVVAYQPAIPTYSTIVSTAGVMGILGSHLGQKVHVDAKIHEGVIPAKDPPWLLLESNPITAKLNFAVMTMLRCWEQHRIVDKYAASNTFSKRVIGDSLPIRSNCRFLWTNG
jgi:hypothetical protein